MRFSFAKAAIALVLVAAVGAAWWWYDANGGERRPAYRLAKIERGPLQAVVVASGTLNAVTTVQVGSQISGQILEILADFNTPVKKDQVIARIDPASFELRVTQARADVDAAQSSVAVQRSAQAAQQAELGRVNVNLAEASRDYERKKSLVEKNFLSPAELDKARTLLAATREQIKAVEAQLRVNEAQIASALATVKQREALLRQAQVDLERTVIRAPVDGTVILRNVDAGQTVAASLQAPVLFAIAQDLRDMQVEAAIDEADVGRLRVGQSTSFTVDAFPRRNFAGEIRQIRKSPQNVQNVVSYTVVISAANPDLALLPGMTANVRVVVEQRERTLKVVNAALRFRPAGAVDARPAGEANAATPVAGEPQGTQAAQEFRQRLFETLKPDETQKAKFEEILADGRQKTIKLREISDTGERRRQFERVRAESRLRIGETLTPAQKPLYERLVAELAGRGAASFAGRIWVLEAGQPKPLEVRLGLTDGTSTEIIAGPLAEGAEVIVGLAAGAEKRDGLPQLRLLH
jgi:HlyD family secretion protein